MPYRMRIFNLHASPWDKPEHEETRDRFPDALKVLREVASPDAAILQLEMDDFCEYDLVDEHVFITGRAVIEKV